VTLISPFLMPRGNDVFPTGQHDAVLPSWAGPISRDVRDGEDSGAATTLHPPIKAISALVDFCLANDPSSRTK